MDSKSAPHSPWWLTGREKDPAWDLYYHRARLYDPSVGRFNCRDPAGMVAGPNLCAFAGDSTVNYVGVLDGEVNRHFDCYRPRQHSIITPLFKIRPLSGLRQE